MLNNEKSKNEYEKRLRSIQKDIDKCDEYKDKIHDLEIKIKSKKLTFSCILNLFVFSKIIQKMYQEMEAEYEINLKNIQMERDQLKLKVNSLEDIIDKYKEEDDSRNKKAHAMIKEVFKPSNVLNK